MSIEDTIGYQNDVPACVVCGKNVQGDRGFAVCAHGPIRPPGEMGLQGLPWRHPIHDPGSWGWTPNRRPPGQPRLLVGRCKPQPPRPGFGAPLLFCCV